MAISRARRWEQEVLCRFLLVSACQATSVVYSLYALGILVYWRESNPELRYVTGVNAAELVVTNGVEKVPGGRGLPGTCRLPSPFEGCLPFIFQTVMEGSFCFCGVYHQRFS